MRMFFANIMDKKIQKIQSRQPKADQYIKIRECDIRKQVKITALGRRAESLVPKNLKFRVMNSC